jgi:hypothetical protein
MRFALLSLLLACSSAAPKSSTPNNDKPAVGKVGDVCDVGSRHKDAAERPVVECGPGLNCCYPCGIDGCDSTCYAGECPTGIP